MSDQDRSIWAKIGAGFEFFGLLLELFATLGKMIVCALIAFALAWFLWALWQ